MSWNGGGAMCRNVRCSHVSSMQHVIPHIRIRIASGTSRAHHTTPIQITHMDECKEFNAWLSTRSQMSAGTHQVPPSDMWECLEPEEPPHLPEGSGVCSQLGFKLQATLPGTWCKSMRIHIRRWCLIICGVSEYPIGRHVYRKCYPYSFVCITVSVPCDVSDIGISDGMSCAHICPDPQKTWHTHGHIVI